MLRLLAAALLLACVPALAQGPAVLTGPQSQEGSVMTPQPFQHVEAPDPSWSAEKLEARADELRGQKLYADAIDYYGAALKKQQDRAVLWNKLGVSELHLMRFEDARKDLEHAVKLDKDMPDAINNLGATHFVLQHYRKAEKLYKRALELRPDSALYHCNLGNAYFSRKDFGKANDEYARALQLDGDIFERQSSGGAVIRPGSPVDRARYFYFLARLYAKNGNLDRSLHYLRRAMEDGYPQINSVYKDQEFAGLRNDPRFTELMSAKPQAVTE
jgi:tetratricopeptide (TPR) repeat protein